jgi:hypothetical protein
MHKVSKKIFYHFVVLLTLMIPMVLFADDDIGSLVGIVLNIVKSLIGLVIASSLLFFFWGLMRFIMHAGDLTKKEDGRSVMIWGIIALFVMVSFLGIIAILQNTFLPGNENSLLGKLRDVLF